MQIEPGGVARITVTTPPITVAEGDAFAGRLTITPVAGVPIRVPWAVVLRRPVGLLGTLKLSEKAFKPSETKPAVVVFQAGRVLSAEHGSTVVPVLRLDVELWTADGKRLGLLARLRDLLPGRYALGITGRNPAGTLLDAGDYRLKVLAWPTGGGSPSSRSVRFTIR